MSRSSSSVESGIEAIRFGVLSLNPPEKPYDVVEVKPTVAVEVCE